jgi:hypothetical protein
MAAGFVDYLRGVLGWWSAAPGSEGPATVDIVYAVRAERPFYVAGGERPVYKAGERIIWRDAQ